MKWPSSKLSAMSKKSFGMFAKAAALEGSGQPLIHLEVGRPFHDTPAHIKKAAIDALLSGEVHYSDLRGLSPLREALAAKLRDFNKIDAIADEVIVTDGLTHASYAAFFASLDQDDEVILLDPYYPQHVSKIEMAGGKVVKAPLDRENNFAIRAEWIRERITPKTRMIVLVNPSNPTGRVYTRAELLDLAQIAIEHDLIVVSDEVYEYITFGQAEHVSIASLPGMRERTVTLFAFTKAYAMDGWRLGYLTADKSMMPALLDVTSSTVTHVNTFIQAGALAAVTADHSHVQEMVDDDRRKRDLVSRYLGQIEGVKYSEPEGTIYAFPDVSFTGQTSDEVAKGILEEAGVAVESGSFYGKGGEGCIRICFGSESYERLEEAMKKISGYLNELGRRE